MHLSTSQVVANYLSKAHVNNFMNYSPPKSQFTSSGNTDNFRDVLNKAPFSSGPSSQRYSPEVDSLRRELTDQIKSHFYTLTSDVNVLKKDNSEYKLQIGELRRELESANSKLQQYKSFQMNNLYPDNDVKSRVNDVLKNNWTKNDKKSDDLNEIHEKLNQLSNQIYTMNIDIESLKKPVCMSREQFTRSMGDVIDELERKLQIINDRVRERIEDMDNSLVRSLNEKEKDFAKLYHDIKGLQSSLTKMNDQVQNKTHSVDSGLENQKKTMSNPLNETKNLSTAQGNIDTNKTKIFQKDEVPLFASGLQLPNKEIETKLRELNSVAQTIGLLEKEMRSKIDMVDLNVNSIKRNLELELSIQLKQMVLPVQKNLEQYLQSTESRFSALEDAVMNHMKRDSYLMTAERVNPRGSNMEENMSLSQKPGFSHISVTEGYGDVRKDRKGSHPDIRLGAGSGNKEKGKALDAFTIDEVHSVMSINDTLQSAFKGEGRYGQRSGYSPVMQNYGASYDEDSNEDEPLPNPTKPVASDKDKSKRQNNTEALFRSFEPQSSPDAMFRDFPSTCAMKTNLEMEHPDNKAQDKLSSKKKKPEIDVNESNKGASKDSRAKSSPGNMTSKLILNPDVLSNDEDEQIPAPRKNVKDNSNRNAALGKAQEIVEDENTEEFSGNIKGLLRKSRNKKENQLSLEEEDYQMKSSQKSRFENQAGPAYGKEPVEDKFKKSNSLQSKGKELSKLDEAKKNQKELPPVDTKSMKNFNKAPPAKPQYPQGYGQPGQNRIQNPGYNQRGGGYDSSEAWAMQHNTGNEEEESVEEIVYHVDEEGFLIDEQGNYLVDEQGNFLQLSPEQMKDIEEKDIVYEKEY